jgi:16S rRNA U1498 N3-methylase RsmE
MASCVWDSHEPARGTNFVLGNSPRATDPCRALSFSLSLSLSLSLCVTRVMRTASRVVELGAAALVQVRRTASRVVELGAAALVPVRRAAPRVVELGAAALVPVRRAASILECVLSFCEGATDERERAP